MSIIDRRGVSVSGVDAPIAGNPNPDLAIKAPVRAATTANITLAGLQTIDGVALAAGDRVLVKNQSTATNNGLYNASTGNWTRTSDANNNSQFANGMLVTVTSGSVNSGKIYQLTTADPTVLGTSNITWQIFSPSPAVFNSSTSGSVPASGGGTTNFLRADATFAAPSGTLLNTITIINGDASEQDTTSFTSAYSAYEIFFEDVLVDTNSVQLSLQVQVSAAFPATGYVSTLYAVSSGGAAGTNLTTGIPLSYPGNLQSGAPGFSGSIRVPNPSVSGKHVWWGMASYLSGAATPSDIVFFGGYYNTAGVITGFKLLTSSGHFTSGKIKVYGIL